MKNFTLLIALFFSLIITAQDDPGKRPELLLGKEVTITDLTKYLIGIELLLEFGDKTAKYTNQGKQNFFQYLPMASNIDLYALGFHFVQW